MSLWMQCLNLQNKILFCIRSGLVVLFFLSVQKAFAQCPACASPALSGGEARGGRSSFDKPLEKGAFRIDLNLQYHPLTRLVHGSDYVSFSELTKRSPEAAEHGDAEFYVFRSDLALHYGLSGHTEVLFSIPYKVLTLRAEIEDEHHRDETFDGLGDIRFGIKHFFHYEKDIQSALLFGLSLPAGRLNKITAASFLSHDMAHEIGVTVPEHSHLQLGTGTFDPFVGIEMLYRFNQYWMLFGNMNIDIPVYENRYDYRTSPAGTLNLGPAFGLTERQFIVSLFGEIFYSGRDYINAEDITGHGGTFDGSYWIPNTGRFEFAIKPGVTWGITDNLTFNLQARIPIYTRIREDSDKRDVQLAEALGVFLGVSYNL